MSDNENIDTTINIQRDTTKEKEILDGLKENILVQEDSDNIIDKKEVINEMVEENHDENFEVITEKQYQLFNDGNSLQKEEFKNISKEVAENKIEEKIKEEINENEIVEEVYTPKTVVLDFSQEIGKLETALEIKYSSLKLTQFPIKLSNIPEGMTFPDQVVIGNTSIKIGKEVINNCNLRILSNESIRMLEIKHREFKLGLSVSLDKDTIKAYGNVRSYEVSSLVKYSRMLKVFEMFEKIFSGEIISFKVNKLYGDVVAEDRIEFMRIKTIQHFFETIDKSGYKFQVDKLPKCENIYYLLELNSAFKEDRVIETWCNFNFKNENLNLYEKDFLIIKRKYQVDKNLTIEEKITLRNPLEKNTIFKEKIVGYRKPCLIELSKVQN